MIETIKLNKIFLNSFYIVLIFILTSCASSSEIINMSSKNLKKNESMIIGSISLNPTIMPLNHDNIDTLNNTSKRKYGNYPFPMNPVFSINYMYGLTNFYEAGLGVDISLIGFTIILNNKIELTGFKNKDKESRIGISYYNKSTFSRGEALIPSHYIPFRKGHFEIGNYLLIGYFFNDLELIFTPHLDFNFLMTNEYESYYIHNGTVFESYSKNSDNKLIKSKITNNNLTYLNYGLNVAIKTKRDFFIEAGIQYVDAKSSFYEPFIKSRFHYSIGIGFALNFNRLKK